MSGKPKQLEEVRRELTGRIKKRRVPAAHSPWKAVIIADLFLSRVLSQALHKDVLVDDWIGLQRTYPGIEASVVPLQNMEKWRVNPETGNISHTSGGFFSVTGITVRHRGPHGEISWDQPVVDQPEVGILGILAAPVNGVLHFCLQAKEEPGNLGPLQLSPTVQATYSNYTRAHGGAATPFLEYFIDPPPERVLFAKLQTEDGGRFLYKSNRNMIVLLDAAPALPGDGFIWLTLRQICRLMGRDNLLHACTRSVLSSLVCTSFSGFTAHNSIPETGLELSDVLNLPPETPGEHPAQHCQLHDAMQWFDDQRAANHILVKRKPMKTLSEWSMLPNGSMGHREKRFFNIIGLSIKGTGREVITWDQPILAPIGTGIIGLLMQRRGGCRYFLMQAKVDAGNRTTIQIGPTVQFTPMNYISNLKLNKPFLFNEFSNNDRFKILLESWQSEEGARFYREQHCHRILLLPEGQEIEIPVDFRWFSEEEICFYLSLGDSVNSCARSILACLL